MEDFFKQFRTNWQNRPDPSFDEKDWEALQKDLDRQTSRRRLAVFPWWKFGVPLVLLLAASNLAFFMEWKQLRQTLNSIEKQRDTIWMTCVEYRADTIFRDREDLDKASNFWPNRLSGNPAYAGLQEFEMPWASGQKGIHLLSQFDATTTFVPAPLAADPEAPPGEKTIEKEVQPNSFWADLELLTLPVFPALTTKEPGLPAPVFLPLSVSKHKKSLKQTLYTLRPKAFAAGIEGGWTYPMQKGVQSQSGYSAGISASIGFSKNIWLWANAGYFNIHFRAGRMGDDIGIPLVPAPSDDFSFQEAEASLPALQYGVGFDYHFRAAKRFKPLVGAGIGQISGIPYEVTYDFIKVSEGIEWSIDKQVTPQGRMPGFLFARTGFDYEIFGRWHWQMMASYRASLNQTARYFPQVWGLQTGLLYHF
ncbi:MAG: hypothetical protein ACKV1O_11480 [Saprospiraceae bacterium]